VWQRQGQIVGRTDKGKRSGQLAIAALRATGTALGAGVATLTRDVIIRVAAGAGFYTAAARLVKAWSGHHIRQ
jgi:hypothetical protein